MKLTIEAETTQESELLKTPFVRTGVQNIVGVGRIGADTMRFHSSGDLYEMIGLTEQVLEELRMELQRKQVTAGVIDAHNLIAKANQDAKILAEAGDLRNGRELRIHRP